MRIKQFIASTALALISGLLSYPAQAQQPASAFACLNDTLAVCKFTLMKRYSNLIGNIDAVIASWYKVDVSGRNIKGDTNARVLGQRKISKGKVQELDSFGFNLDSNGLVDNISLSIDYNPAKASTLEEYDKTKIFGLISVFFNSGSCPYGEKLAFYRFFNDQIKPTISRPKRDGFIGVGSATDEYQYRSSRIPICGAYIDYRRDTGVSTYFMDTDNPSGRFDNIKLILWRDPSPY